jgi:hypothetical protein
MATTEEVAECMMKMVNEFAGKKRLKPGDLIKHAQAELGADKKESKDAIRMLTDDNKLVYSYFGGTWLELPYQEGASKSEAQASGSES